MTYLSILDFRLIILWIILLIDELGFSIDYVSAIHSFRIDEFKLIVWVLCGLFIDLGAVILFDEFGFVREVFGHALTLGLLCFLSLSSCWS